MSMRRATFLVAALILAGCGDKPPAAPAGPAAGTAPAAVPAPADPKLAKLYDQTCKACHSSAGTGAPQSGDRAAWAPRVAQGMPALIQHTVSGYKGMPPLGSCMDCTEAEFEALIRFMTGEAP